MRTYIVMPSVVFGLSSGRIASAGLSGRHSIFVRWIMNAAIERGSVGIYGPGTNTTPYIHTEDLAELYVTLFSALLKDPARPGHGWEGFYFGETGELRSIDTANAIGDALVKLGKIKPSGPVPAPWTDEDTTKHFYGVRTTFHDCHAKQTLTAGHSSGSWATTVMPSGPVHVLWDGSRSTLLRTTW